MVSVQRGKLLINTNDRRKDILLKAQDCGGFIFLPPQRTLGKLYKVSSITIHKDLKFLKQNFWEDVEDLVSSTRDMFLKAVKKADAEGKTSAAAYLMRDMCSFLMSAGKIEKAAETINIVDKLKQALNEEMEDVSSKRGNKQEGRT